MIFVSHRSGAADIWRQNLATGTESALGISPRPDEPALFSSDGSRVAFSAHEGPDHAIYVLDTSGGPARKVCQRGGMLMDWSADGRRILFGAGNRRAIFLLMVEDGRVIELAKDAQRSLGNAVFSPDGGWLAWQIGDDVVVARFLNEKQVAANDAVVVARTIDSEAFPNWSPDGRLLYYYSKENGYRCLWAQRMDPATKEPRGQPIGIWHLHESLHKIWTYARFSVSRDHLVLPLTEGTSNIWTANWN